MSNYTHDVIKIASDMNEHLSVDYSPITNKYQVHIRNVMCKAKNDPYFRKMINGYGVTIHDACMDYIRKARGEQLIHSITDKIIEAI